MTRKEGAAGEEQVGVLQPAGDAGASLPGQAGRLLLSGSSVVSHMRGGVQRGLG